METCGNVCLVKARGSDFIEVGIDVLHLLQPGCMNLQHLKDPFAKRLGYDGSGA